MSLIIALCCHRSGLPKPAVHLYEAQNVSDRGDQCGGSSNVAMTSGKFEYKRGKNEGKV